MRERNNTALHNYYDKNFAPHVSQANMVGNINLIECFSIVNNFILWWLVLLSLTISFIINFTINDLLYVLRGLQHRSCGAF